MKIIRLSLRALFTCCLIGSTLSQASLYTPAPVQFEEDHSLPLVYFNIVADVGAVQDPQNKLGLAYIASQMLLRGTQRHSKTDFFRNLESLGGSLDIDVRSEGVVLRGAVLSTNLEAYLNLVEETLVKPKFTAEELAKLKKETESAILEQMSDDMSLGGAHFLRFFYGKHPYGNPTMGTIKTLKNITSTDVIDFYTLHFGLNTLALFGTGDTTDENIKNWFSKVVTKLAALHPTAKTVSSIAEAELPMHGRRAQIVDKPNTTQTQIFIGGRGMRPSTKGFYEILLANHSFGGSSFQARLMQELRVKRGWTYGASNAFRFGKETKHFVMFSFPKTSDSIASIELMLKLFTDFVNNGISKIEYEFARDSLVNNAPFNYDTPRKRLENATSEYLLNFPKDYYKDFAKHIDDVSYDDITPALKSFFHPEMLTLSILGDASKIKPKLKQLGEFETISVKKYTEDLSIVK